MGKRGWHGHLAMSRRFRRPTRPRPRRVALLGLHLGSPPAGTGNKRALDPPACCAVRGAIQVRRCAACGVKMHPPGSAELPFGMGFPPLLMPALANQRSASGTCCAPLGRVCTKARKPGAAVQLAGSSLSSAPGNLCFAPLGRRAGVFRGGESRRAGKHWVPRSDGPHRGSSGRPLAPSRVFATLRVCGEPPSLWLGPRLPLP